jgi:hypothetical protein
MNRDLDWEGCANVRDLGGLVTADGRTTTVGALVRADNARRLTNAGWASAWAYGIRTVLDLRAPSESVADPPAHPSFAHAAISLFDHFDGDPAYRRALIDRLSAEEAPEQNRALYLDALRLDAPRFAEALTAIANACPGGILVHCAQGKDRTGLFAALLLRLVDVPMELVDADYVRSADRLGFADSTPREVVDHVISVVEAEHGSVAEYFLSAGSSAADLEGVARRLLDDREPSAYLEVAGSNPAPDT